MATGKLCLSLLVLCCTISICAGFGYVAVANRGASTISIINEETNEVVRTIDCTQDTERDVIPEPMYPIVSGQYMFVGDRRGKLVMIYDIADNLTWVHDVPTGAGIFHMYNNPDNTEFWVLNDLDDTITIFDPSGPPFDVITTLNLPSDCCFNGAPLPKPHDIIFHPNGIWAYVTIFGVPGASDLIIRYLVANHTEVDRIEVGKSPHVGLLSGPTTDKVWPMFVPSQGTLIDSVAVIDPDTMERIDSIIGISGAHGIYGPSADKRTWYVTNLPGQGLSGLIPFDGVKYDVILEGITDVPHSVPHNIAMNTAGTRLYLTHSGANIQTSVWTIGDPEDPQPKLLTEVDCGLNAYGIFHFDTDVDLGGNSPASVLSGFVFTFLSYLQ